MQHPQKLAHARTHDDPRAASRPDPESGIVLLMVVFLTFLLLLSLAIAAPNWAKSLQRQKEIETIHRGQQYERAIQVYYRKFHRYPNTIKQLMDTNDERFLRQKYKDPLTGKDDWKLVLYGHAHVHPLGLFGKPLSDLGAVQSSGGMYAASGNSGSSTSGPSASNSESSTPGLDSSPTSGSTSGIGSPIGGSSLGGSSLGGSSLSSSPSGGLNSKSTLGSPTSSNGGFQTNAPFVGVVPPIKGHSIVDYRAQNNYDRWEFNYDPVVDELRAKVSILGGSMSDLNGASNLNGSNDNSKKSTTNSNSPFSGINGSGSLGGTNNSGNGSSSSGSSSTNSGNSDSNNPQ